MPHEGINISYGIKIYESLRMFFRLQEFAMKH